MEYHWLKSNGKFSIFRDVYSKKQHPNQQNGTDEYVDVVNHSTGNINSLKIYLNAKGEKYFKKNGSHKIDDFNEVIKYIPFQIIRSKQVRGNENE